MKNSGYKGGVSFDGVGRGIGSGELMQLTDAAAGLMMDQAKLVMGMMIGYKELMMMYTCAMKEIETKFDVLNTEFNVRYRRNPISSVSSRLKRTTGIVEKMLRRGYSMDLDSMVEHIHDVAGVRVICPYIDDIYTIAEAFLSQDDITLIQRKDYIESPKANGYRSLHLIVGVPVFFADERREIKVEVQIRTIAMDFWASLEHQMRYKQEIDDEEEIVSELKDCAEVIRRTDERMLALRKRIESAKDVPTEEELLLERFSKLDIRF